MIGNAASTKIADHQILPARAVGDFFHRRWGRFKNVDRRCGALSPHAKSVMPIILLSKEDRPCSRKMLERVPVSSRIVMYQSTILSQERSSLAGALGGFGNGGGMLTVTGPSYLRMNLPVRRHRMRKCRCWNLRQGVCYLE